MFSGYKIILAGLGVLAMSSNEGRAADLAEPQAMQEESPLYWDGFYGGGHISWSMVGKRYQADYKHPEDLFGNVEIAIDESVFGFGLLIGFDKLHGKWVFGGRVSYDPLELSYSFACTVGQQVGDKTCPGLEPDVDISKLWSASLRLGYVPEREEEDNYMIYLLGGIAGAGIKVTDTLQGDQPDEPDQDKASHFGFLVGVGVEHMLTDKIALHLEYNYMDLGEEDYLVSLNIDRMDVHLHSLKLGLTYQF